MRWGLLLSLWACSTPPDWIEEAPLLGARMQDDAGRHLYLSHAPQRVAVLSRAALPLWYKLGLDSLIQATCAPTEYETQRSLPCETPALLQEALIHDTSLWIWTDTLEKLSGLSTNRVYVFAPKSMEAWLKHWKMLCLLYQKPQALWEADRLEKIWRSFVTKTTSTRRFRVAVLSPSYYPTLLTMAHPLAGLIQEAGGIVPYRGSTPWWPGIPAETLQTYPPDILLVPAQHPERLQDFLAQYPTAHGFPAVRYLRVFTIDNSLLENPWSNPIETFLFLLRILHPELIGIASPPQALPEIPQPAQE
ncbi:MAG: hypothetical protein NZ580_05820 [Bacteroidia bacterium]|nr:hypothetical protein [Bacteroidia bacterium]MDW8236143.1 hypothetical protein [Bacteroidia bacterium]